MIIDPSLRDMILFIYRHFHNLSSGSGGGGNVTTSQLNTALADKVDKGGYTGTAQDLKNAIDTVDSKTIHWNDVQNKPELDFIPTSWNKKNNKEVIRTQVDNWLRLNDNNTHEDGVYLGESVVRTDGQLQVGPNGNVFRTDSTVDIEGIILGDEVRISKHGSDSIVFGDAELTQLVYGEFKGIKIWNNADNNKVVLAGGGVKPLSELDNKNIQIGGRNLALNTGVIGEININNTSAAVIHQELVYIMENLQEGDLCMLSFDAKTVIPNAESTLHVESYGDNSTTPGQGVVEVKGNKYKRYSVYVKLLDASDKRLFVWIDAGKSDILIKDLKLYRGTQIEDWTPAPEDTDTIVLVDKVFNSVNNAFLAESSGKNIVFANSTDVVVSLNNIRGDTLTKIIKKTPNKITFTGGIYLTSNEISGVGVFEVYLGNDGKVIIR